MWKHIFDNEYTRIWLCEYVQLVMSGYGHDESAPTPDGVFATNFVGGRWCFAECFTTNFVVAVGNWRSVRNQFRGERGELTECFATNFVVDVGN